jgi:putative membrane protein
VSGNGPDGAGAVRRLHPLTPLANAVQTAPVILAAIIFAGSISLGLRILIGIALTVVLGSVIGAISYLEWSRFSFWFDDAGDLRVDSGVLQQKRQKLALSRLQSVDVNEPFWARLFGLAQVTVEVAGAGDSRVVLRYLDTPGAHSLRNELLARAAGLHAAAPAAPEQVLTTVPASTLLLSLLLRTQTLALFVLSGFLLITAFATGGVGALGIALVTGGVPAFAVVGEFLRSYGFTVARSPDGLRVRRGLTSTVANTVPPGRVHAVGFTSGPVWRRLGWVRVLLDLGGNPGAGDPDQQGATVLLPVSTWPVALEVVTHVLPGMDLGPPEFEGIPRRARFRSPLQQPLVGVAITPQVFVARRGWLTQWLTVVPHERVQSARVTQGPLERALGLASLHVDSVPGPVRVTVPHMAESRAREALEAELDLARDARSTAGPDRWMAGSPDEPRSDPRETGAHGSVDRPQAGTDRRRALGPRAEGQAGPGGP